MHKGFFYFDFSMFKPEYEEYQIISRVPFFSALLLFRASCVLFDVCNELCYSSLDRNLSWGAADGEGIHA